MKKLLIALIALMALGVFGGLSYVVDNTIKNLTNIEAHNEYITILSTTTQNCSQGGKLTYTTQQLPYPTLKATDYELSYYEYSYDNHMKTWDLPRITYEDKVGGSGFIGSHMIATDNVLYTDFGYKSMYIDCFEPVANVFTKIVFVKIDDSTLVVSGDNLEDVPDGFMNLYGDYILTDYEKAQVLQFQLNYVFVDYLLFADTQANDKWESPSFVGSPNVGGIDEQLNAVMKSRPDIQWVIDVLDKFNELQYGIIFENEEHYNSCLDFVINY